MNAIINFFKTKAGVHPPEHKAESTQLPIATLPLPSKLVLPLRQHIGNMPKILVSVGDTVLKGQLLATPECAVSAAIHAPTSGTIAAISEEVIPHPSGLPDLCITLIPDGKETWAPLSALDWHNTPKQELVASLCKSGIVGFGGATFPTHIKLRSNGKSNVHTLIINAAECEPYITCDDMLMREYADEIIKGIEIAQHLLGASKSIIGIEDNKPQAITAMQAACAGKPITVSIVPTLYPSGDARQLIRLVSGLEIPHNKRATEMGVQVFNVATVRAIYRYVSLGEPAISRIVTVTGNVQTPQNFEVLFGTPLPELIQAAGGAKAATTHYIMGGPMMGFDLPSEQVPITKAANCIIAAAPNLFAAPPPAMPCIRCARCADACPVNLQPQELYWFSKSDNFEKARDYNLFDCIECGCCTYVCPSDIPLVQYYRYAKSEIIAIDKAKEAADLARERNDFRLARIEREKL
ncbi:MAG: electron transport complex subunit RsxC, partial [Methylotenera sp.]|nr:electron transport complex subunit RsxC [Methylotenera sp.]